MIAVTVKDNGEGIAPELLPHVFERHKSGNGNSTGLGLSICKQIVEAYGGEITVNSVPGEGTTVRFILPIDESEETQ